MKSLIKHHHNEGFRRPCWTDFHLALCAGESHLVFGVGAEGSKPSCPDYGETAFLSNTLSFTDIIHVQIILGPIVHPLRFQILAESSDKCNGRAGDIFHIRLRAIPFVQTTQLGRTTSNLFLKNINNLEMYNHSFFLLTWRHEVTDREGTHKRQLWRSPSKFWDCLSWWQIISIKSCVLCNIKIMCFKDLSNLPIVIRQMLFYVDHWDRRQTTQNEEALSSWHHKNICFFFNLFLDLMFNLDNII